MCVLSSKIGSQSQGALGFIPGRERNRTCQAVAAEQLRKHQHCFVVAVIVVLFPVSNSLPECGPGDTWLPLEVPQECRSQTDLDVR